MPSTHFLRSGDYLKFLRGLGKVSTKISAQLHVFFSLWRLTWVFDGTGKNFHKKVCPVICFFAVETISSFWWGLEKFPQKFVPRYTFFSLWRLTWVFDGTWKNFHKKVCPVTRFFAVETILSFWWDLESFGKKMWPVTRFFAAETILSVWVDLESFDKKLWPATHFFRSADYLKFWMGLRKVSTKISAQLHVFFSLWKLTWVFDGTGKNFHKKVCPVICFFAVETISSFWWDLEKFPQKFVPRYTFFFRCGN